MNPGCSLVDMLLFPIHFHFRKNKGNTTVWPPPLDCTLGWARKRRLAASSEKTAQSDCHWCLNEMKVGAKRKKQDEQADIRLFSDGKQVDTYKVVPWSKIPRQFLNKCEKISRLNGSVL